MRTANAESSGLRHQHPFFPQRAGKAKPTSASSWLAPAKSTASLARELLDELAEKLQLKLSFTAEQSVEALADFLTFLASFPITGQLKAVPAGPDDDKVLECAALGGATHVVTGDRRHLLPLCAFQGVAIVTAAEFLRVASSP